MDEKLARLKWSAAEKNALVNAMYRAGISIKALCLNGHRKYLIGSADAGMGKREVEIGTVTM